MSAYKKSETIININYTKADIVGYEFDNCQFIDCEFAGVDLTKCSFTDCDFNNCDISNVILKQTTLHNVGFSSCKMLGLIFADCNPFLLAFNFKDCNLSYCSFYKLKAHNTKFKNCNLQEADFASADFTGALFEGCNLLGASFDNTALEKADLRSAIGFSIDPENNKIAYAKFSSYGLEGLLHKYKIEIE